MENYVLAATFSDEVEARLAQATLAAAGIESFLKLDDAGGMLPVFQEGSGVGVLVSEENLQEAKTLLSSDAESQPDDA